MEDHSLYPAAVNGDSRLLEPPGVEFGTGQATRWYPQPIGDSLNEQQVSKDHAFPVV